MILNKALWEAVLGNSRDAFLVVIDGNPLAANPAFEKLLGVSKAQALALDFLSSAQKIVWHDVINEVIATGAQRVVRFELRSLCSDYAPPSPFLVSLSPYSAGTPRISVVSCLFDRQVLEDPSWDLISAHDREEWLRFFFATCPLAMFLVESTEDDDLRTVFCNKAGRELLGFKSPTDHVNKKIGSMLGGVGWWPQALRVQVSTLQAPPRVYEHQLDNDPRLFRIQTLPAPTGSNGRARLYLLVEDISEKRRLEQELKMKTQSLDEKMAEVSLPQRFFDNAPLMMGLVELTEDETDLTHILANPAVVQFSGTPSREGWRSQMPQDVCDLFIRNYKKRVASFPLRAVFSHSLPSRDLQQPVEFDNVCVLNGARWCFWNFVAHIGGRRFLYISMDKTTIYRSQEELKRHHLELEEAVAMRTRQLEEALQVKNRFLAIVSHEIRTPLAGVIGSMTLLADTALSAEQQNLLRTAQTCSEQLLVVINDILDITRIQENRVALVSAPFQVLSLLDEVLDVISFSLSTKSGLELLCDVHESVPAVVMGDKSRLRQILINLLSNAVKFTERGEVLLSASSRCLAVTTDAEHDPTTAACKHSGCNAACEIVICVKDTGIGITDEMKPRLFQPFSQGDSSTTRKYGGSGLGLSICKHLSELMGGSMWFESELGKGSSFSFKIQTTPVYDQALAPSSGPQPPWLHGMHIVIIEANHTQLEILARTLAHHGCIVTSTASAATAVSHLRLQEACPPPGHAGPSSVQAGTVDTSGRLPSKRPLSQPVSVTPAIVLVDSNQPEELIRILREMPRVRVFTMDYRFGVTSPDFLKKPVGPQRLLNTVSLAAAELQGVATVTVATPPRRANKKPRRPGIRILVAEDNLTNQMIVKKLLENEGQCDVTIVENGQQALEAVRSSGQKPFHILLLDLMMPLLGGCEAAQAIRNLNLPHPPIIVALTANAFTEDKLRCLNAGMSQVLTKPLKRQELAQLLESVHQQAEDAEGKALEEH